MLRESLYLILTWWRKFWANFLSLSTIIPSFTECMHLWSFIIWISKESWSKCCTSCSTMLDPRLYIRVSTLTCLRLVSILQKNGFKVWGNFSPKTWDVIELRSIPWLVDKWWSGGSTLLLKRLLMLVKVRSRSSMQSWKKRECSTRIRKSITKRWQRRLNGFSKELVPSLSTRSLP